jgi:hypothetical protein
MVRNSYIEIKIYIYIYIYDKTTSINFRFGKVWSHLNRTLTLDNLVFRDK